MPNGNKGLVYLTEQEKRILLVALDNLNVVQNVRRKLEA